MNYLTIREWKKAFVEGKFSKNDVETQKKAGWHFFKCKDSAVKARTYEFATIITRIVTGIKIPENYDVIFRNVKMGKLYDAIYLGQNFDGGLTILIGNPNSNMKYTVLHTATAEQFYETNSKKELIVWLNTPWTAEEEKFLAGACKEVVEN